MKRKINQKKNHKKKGWLKFKDIKKDSKNKDKINIKGDKREDNKEEENITEERREGISEDSELFNKNTDKEEVIKKKKL